MSNGRVDAVDIRPRADATRLGAIAFGAALLIGVIYVGTQLIGDLVEVRDA